MNKIIKITLSALILFSLNEVFAEEKPEENGMSFYWSVSTKEYYSSGLSDSYFYNKSSVKGGFENDYFDLNATIQKYFNYQLTDGLSDYDYRSINEAGFSCTFKIMNIINITGEYFRGDDFTNFTKNAINPGIEFDFSPVILSADYSFEQMSYEMNSLSVDNKKQDYSFTLEYSFTDSFSLDLGYSFSTDYFNTLGYAYNKYTIRAGMSDFITDNLFLIAGAGAGKDSADYNILSADCGVTAKLFSLVKLTLSYNINYYPAQDTTSSSKSGGGAGSGSGKLNPYSSSGGTGDAVISHFLSFGMTLAF